MTYEWLRLEKAYAGLAVPQRLAFFSVCGTAVAWNFGYPFDLGQALDDEVWVHQPIGYPATTFPMRPSYTAGEVEFVRQLGIWKCETRPWAFAGYSQGAIVTSNILDRLKTDLAKYAPTFMGGVTWGNPRREGGHTLPGGIDPGGSGIVLPNLVDTPDSVWDFAAGAKMVGSPGNDLYTTCGTGETAAAIADQRAVWNIVDQGTITSAAPLALQILKILPNPITGGIGAIEAALGALGFFASGTAPHLNYQSVQPIRGDSRDCWRIALDHITELGLTTQARAA